LTNRHPSVVSSSAIPRAKGASALFITNGARDMLSTPPAIARSISPIAMARAAVATASRLDAQRRLTVEPGTPSGNPASSSAIRPTLRLSSPAWFAHP
jgi:hypothetical protein